MSLPAWQYKFDHAQRRFSRLRIGIALAGANLLDYGYSSNVYIDPITKSVMLRPRCLDDGWYTSNAGAYAKLAPSDFGSPAGITIYDQQGNGARPFLVGEKNITLQTTATYAKNTGFVISYLAFNNGTNGIVLEFGWSSGTVHTVDTAVRIFHNGFGEIWRSGVLIATGNVAGNKAPDNTQNQTVTLIVLPHRLRELLVFSTTGAGFRGIFPDIDEDATSPTITPASKFWLRQPDVSTNVLIAPLRFNTTGYAISELYTLGEAPDGTDTLETFANASWAGGAGQTYRLYGNQSYRTGNTDAGTCSIVGSTGGVFTPDGSLRECRLKVTLTGDGNSSPLLYGAEMGYSGRAAVTNDSEEYDATDAIILHTINVPDGGGPTGNIEVLATTDVVAAVAGLRKQANRPFQISCGSTHIANARLSAPKYSRKLHARSERIAFEYSTTIKALKNYRFRDKKPLSGMLLSHATDECLVRFLLRQVGVQDAAMDLETSTVVIDDIPPRECGDWNESAEVNASAWEVLERMMDDYLGGWFYDEVPTASGIKFKVCSQSTLEAAAVVTTLYWDDTAALGAGILQADLWKHVVREMDVQVVESETNEITIFGVDQRTGKAVGSVKRDYDSQDPTLAPSARPDNWHGEPIIVGVINAGISSQTIADGAVDFMAAKLFPARKIIEIESQFILADEVTGVPLWRGQRVTLEGVDYIVQTLSMTTVSNAPGFEWNPTRYTLSNIVGSTGGMTAADIAAREARNRKERAIQRRNSTGVSLLTRSIFSVVV